MMEKTAIASHVAAAAVALLVLVSLLTPAASTDPKCCVDFHVWGDNNNNKGCPPEKNDACNTWCQRTCRGGECKLRQHGWHYCHCYC